MQVGHFVLRLFLLTSLLFVISSLAEDRLDDEEDARIDREAEKGFINYKLLNLFFAQGIKKNIIIYFFLEI